MSAWVQHCKRYAKENGCSYREAMSSSGCKSAYHGGKQQGGSFLGIKHIDKKFNKAVGKVESGAKGAFQDTKQFARKSAREVEQGARGAWKDTKQGARGAWQDTKQGARGAWQDTKQGAKGAWQDTKQGAKVAIRDTGRFARKAGNQIENTANIAVRDTGRFAKKAVRQVDNGLARAVDNSEDIIRKVDHGIDTAVRKSGKVTNIAKRATRIGAKIIGTANDLGLKYIPGVGQASMAAEEVANGAALAAKRIDQERDQLAGGSFRVQGGALRLPRSISAREGGSMYDEPEDHIRFGNSYDHLFFRKESLAKGVNQTDPPRGLYHGGGFRY